MYLKPVHVQKEKQRLSQSTFFYYIVKCTNVGNSKSFVWIHGSGPELKRLCLVTALFLAESQVV